MSRELVYLDDVKLQLYKYGQHEAIRCLTGIHRADAAPVIHAHWVKQNHALEIDGFYRPQYACSNCGDIAPYRNNFCGECGALMDEEGSEDG